MEEDLITQLTEEYTTHDLFAMVDLNENATDREIQAKTESIVLSYLRIRNRERASFFQEVQRRLLEHSRTEGRVANTERHLDPAPLRQNVRSQFISIHSQFRTDYHNQPSTNYTFQLADLYRVTSMRIVAVEIPRMYYTISSLIGNATMMVYNHSDLRAWLVTLADGNYDVPLTLSEGCFDNNIEAVNMAIRSAVAGTLVDDQFTADESVASLDEADLLYDIDPRTHKSIFTSESGAVDAIRFNVDENGALDSSKLAKFGFGCAIGFRYGERTFETTLTSEGAAFLSGPSYWFISVAETSNTPHSEPFVVAYNGWSSTNNILSRVDVAHDSERRIVRSHLSAPRRYKGSADIQKLSIQLLDEYGRTVDLNEMDWSMVLEVETLELGWETG